MTLLGSALAGNVTQATANLPLEPRLSGTATNVIRVELAARRWVSQRAETRCWACQAGLSLRIWARCSIAGAARATSAAPIRAHKIRAERTAHPQQLRSHSARLIVMPRFTIKRGDSRLRCVFVLLPDSVSLAGATVRFQMRARGGPTVIDRPAIIQSSFEPAVVAHLWLPGETDAPGRFDAESPRDLHGRHRRDLPQSRLHRGVCHRGCAGLAGLKRHCAQRCSAYPATHP